MKRVSPILLAALLLPPALLAAEAEQYVPETDPLVLQKIR